MQNDGRALNAAGSVPLLRLSEEIFAVCAVGACTVLITIVFDKVGFSMWLLCIAAIPIVAVATIHGESRRRIIALERQVAELQRAGRTNHRNAS